MTVEQRGSGMGLHEHVGAALYEQDGETLVTLLSPEEEAVQFLLDGLGVESIAELKRLVDTGRATDEIMGPIRDELRAAGVPEDLLPTLATTRVEG